MADIKPTNADYGTAYASAGVSVLNSIAGAFLSVNAFESQMKAQTDAKIANMENVVTNYEYEAYKLKEDIALMDSMFADKISERSLQGMKDFATMKAAAAETGTMGGSTKEATIMAHSDAAFDIALINQKRRAGNYAAVKQQDKSKMDAISALKGLKSGGIDYESNALFSGLAGFSSALGNILTTMPNSVRAEVFDFSTKGHDVDPMSLNKF